MKICLTFILMLIIILFEIPACNNYQYLPIIVVNHDDVTYSTKYKDNIKETCCEVKHVDVKLLTKIKHHLKLIKLLAKKYELDPYLVIGLIYIESKFNHHVTSKTGSYGLMQFNIITRKELNVTKKTSIYRHLDVGVKYLKYLLNMFNDEMLALGAYNVGPTGIIVNVIDQDIVCYVNQILNYRVYFRMIFEKR